MYFMDSTAFHYRFEKVSWSQLRLIQFLWDVGIKRGPNSYPCFQFYRHLEWIFHAFYLKLINEPEGA